MLCVVLSTLPAISVRVHLPLPKMKVASVAKVVKVAAVAVKAVAKAANGMVAVRVKTPANVAKVVEDVAVTVVQNSDVGSRSMTS